VSPLLASWLGRVDYKPAFAAQTALAGRRAAGEIPDVLLLLEHEPVYTIGRRGTEGEILLDLEGLAARSIGVEHTDRGGRVTYHGPGQLVGYPIIDLGRTNDLVGYVRAIERALVATAAAYGVESETVSGLTGVWAGRDKLAAIGVHVSRGITTHGFAMNVTTDLTAFNGIIPCGIVDRGVTSLAALTGREVPVTDVAWTAARALAGELGRSLALVEPALIGVREAAHVSR
jgi:lipoyl(octanoyl) transferase